MTTFLVRLANAIAILIGRGLTPVAALVRYLPEGLRTRWFGSDVLVGATTHYTWLANQFGHFTIGLALYVLMRQVAAWISFNSLEGNAVGSPILDVLALILTVVLYAVKETADYRLAEVPGRQFAIENVELRLDGFADTFFVAFGAVFLMTANWGWLAWGIAVVLFGAVAVLLAGFYLPRADRFDFSGLPHYYRLPLFQGEARALTEAGPNRDLGTALVTDVSCNRCDRDVLLVLGGPGTGRTSLVVGIGTRLAIAKAKLRYVAAAKLDEFFAQELAAAPAARRRLGLSFDVWPLEEVTHVIVDDVPAGPPENFLLGLSDPVRRYLHDRILILVICGGAEDDAAAAATALGWAEALQRLVRPEAKVASVLLTRELDPRQRNTARVVPVVDA
jgi:hypothetical protein